MAYNTPELLLVGAAQNLVLGLRMAKLDSSSEQCFDGDTLSYDHTPDCASW